MAAVSAQSRRTSKARRIQRARRTVTTTARLHFGFLDPSGRGKRPFGSFGLSLDRPTTRLMLERADRFEASGPERERGLRYLRSIAASSGVERRSTGSRSRRRSRRMRGSARARSLRSRSARHSPLSRTFASTRRRSPRGSGAAPGPASASPPSPKAASCSTVGRAEAGCRSLSAASPSPPNGACF